jgi:hypothetical protein
MKGVKAFSHDLKRVR